MPLTIGDEAPNFDLSSTENALLMLRDEVARLPVLLYVFLDAGAERVRRDLAELAAGDGATAGARLRVLGLSKSPLAELARLQVEARLPFPLVHDDRAFCAAYDVVAREDGTPPGPALVLVHRDLRVLWLANPVASVATALREVKTALGAQGSPVAGYPRTVINRFIDRLVN